MPKKRINIISQQKREERLKQAELQKAERRAASAKMALAEYQKKMEELDRQGDPAPQLTKKEARKERRQAQAAAKKNNPAPSPIINSPIINSPIIKRDKPAESNSTYATITELLLSLPDGECKPDAQPQPYVQPQSDAQPKPTQFAQREVDITESARHRLTIQKAKTDAEKQKAKTTGARIVRNHTTYCEGVERIVGLLERDERFADVTVEPGIISSQHANCENLCIRYQRESRNGYAYKFIARKGSVAQDITITVGSQSTLTGEDIEKLIANIIEPDKNLVNRNTTTDNTVDGVSEICLATYNRQLFSEAKHDHIKESQEKSLQQQISSDVHKFSNAVTERARKIRSIVGHDKAHAYAIRDMKQRFKVTYNGTNQMSKSLQQHVEQQRAAKAATEAKKKLDEAKSKSKSEITAADKATARLDAKAAARAAAAIASTVPGGRRY